MYYSVSILPKISRTPRQEEGALKIGKFCKNLVSELDPNSTVRGHNTLSYLTRHLKLLNPGAETPPAKHPRSQSLRSFGQRLKKTSGLWGRECRRREKSGV